jgi:hypothetical protein
MAKLTHTGTHNNAAFGQYGAIYAQTVEQAVVPPNGMIFCAIQFLSDTSFQALVSEDPVGLEFEQHHEGQILTAAAANSSEFIQQDIADLTTTDMAVGDLVYHEDGNFLGAVKLISRNATDTGVDGDAFHLDRDPGTNAVLNDDKLTVIKPNSTEGGGSGDIDTDVVFPKGLTIYGAWKSFALKTGEDYSAAGVIAYLAPANGPEAI